MRLGEGHCEGRCSQDNRTDKKDEWLREQPLGRIMLAFLLLASGIVEVLKEEEKIDLSRDVLDIAKILFDSNRDPLADMMVA
ncbi:MAG: hypothetical protein DSO07_00035 [Thermoproteota archaeon]|nr:MAG: hypothetical protein DSO07_00035 [Candidatus Korarchaeota archaeon]